MRIVLLVLTVLVALTASVPVASASTVGRDQFGFLLFRGEGAEENRLTMTETDTDYVFEDAPGITLTPGEGCRDDGDAATTNVVLCAQTNQGVTVVELGDGDDEIVEVDVDFEGYLYRGGEGDDVLRASSGFRSSVTMHGEGGTDTYFPGRPGVNFEVVSYMHRTDDLVLTMNDVADDPEGESVPSTMTGVVGGFGDDLLVGSGKGDYLAGGNGDDRAQGMAGSDNVNGSNGDDLLEGGDGNDVFPGEVGADRIEGGEGFDRFEVRNSGYDMAVARDVTVTLDDVANDGGSGERDDVRTDVEDVTAVPAGNFGRATLVGDASVNVLRGSREGDTIDGGAGSDLLDGLGGDDTFNARDGFTDRIQCGAGTDTAVVDAADQVANCENVDRAAPPAGPAPAGPPGDDRPPTVAFASPREDTLIGTTRASAVTVEAADDRAVSRVLLVDDGRVVGVDSTAPYRFDYEPTGDDVGRNTLVAVAVDSSEQTGTAVRPVRVDRFLPVVRRSVQPVRDRRAPYRFRVIGGIGLPRTVTAATACREGFVSVQVKRGTRTISTRRVQIKRSCGFSSTVTFRDRRRLGNGRLTLTVRWLGNEILAPRASAPLRVRAG